MIFFFQCLELRIAFQQQAVAESVKCSQAYGPAPLPGRLGDPVLHFRRRFVGEG